MPKPLALLYVFILLMGMSGFAQTQIEPESLTIEDGLSQGYVLSTLQDREGFMWFSSKNGLNRYDGKQFEIYTHNLDDPYSISNDWVTSILEEGDFLIIGTRSPYLNLFHKKTKRFYRLPLVVNSVKTFTEINKIHVDSVGQYWVGTVDPGQLLRINFPDRFWLEFPQDTMPLKEVAVDLARNGKFHGTNGNSTNFLIVGDTLGTSVQVLNAHSLDTFTPDPKSIFATFPYFKKIGPKLGVCGTLIYGGDLAFNLCRLINETWEVIPSDYLIKNGIHYDKGSNLIWLQNYEDMLVLAFDADRVQELTKIEAQQADFVINNLNEVVCQFYSDRSGILWMGTNGLGIRKLSPRKLAIKNYLPGASMQPINLISIYEGALIYPYDQVISSSVKQSNPEVINRKIKETIPFEVSWLDEGPDQQWLATAIGQSDENFNLVLYQYQKDQLIEKMKIPLRYTVPESDMSLLRAKDRKLYISLDRYFVCYDSISGTHQSYSIDLLGKKSYTIFFMAHTANGDFWIGTTSGLIRVQAKADGFEFNWVEGLRNDICASVLTDPKNPSILWIGTKGGGLHRLDTETMQFTYLDTRNGLPNDVIYGVLNDAEGNLWLSSNKGIISYNPETAKIRNFTAADGMQSDEFNTFNFGKSPAGNMLFAGINGLSIFNPEDLKDNPNVPEVRLTGLAINNKSISVLDSASLLEQSIEFTNELNLSYAENSLNLTFAALEFTTPSKNTYTYYLEGAEAEWAHTTTNNEATYLNLAPGQYTFKIKAANGDLVWGDKVTRLAITIRPPWYRTNFAYFVYCLLLGLLFGYSRQVQRKRLQLKYSLDLEKQEADRLKELEGFRSRLYTNITHEFRTPLTVILGTSEQLQSQKHENHPEQKQLSLIQRNGKNLLHLVNQMLDLSKIEHNKLQVNYQQGDILRYLRYIAESYYSLANSNNVLLKVESNQTEILMDYDVEKMRQIIANLLSNAIKYTPSGGKVLLRVQEESKYLQIQVKDTGRGIAASTIPHIFERYYQGEDEIAKTGGTGIGLALTRELVHLLDGSIAVESELGKGAVFTVLLPIRRQAAMQKEVPVVAEIAAVPKAVPVELQKNTRLKEVPKVLVIEDNLDVVEYLSSCLQMHYDLDFAYNGQAGIEKAYEINPDLIISDVMMPEKTGFEVTDTLKNDARTSHIPIVLLTAKADIESRLAGLKRGADVYLPKPFHQEELLANVDNLLALRKKLQSKYQELALSNDSPKILPKDDQEQLFLQNLRQFLEAELDNSSLKAADAARAIGMSRANLYAKLNAVTGMSFNIYLRTLRLNKAKQLLQSTSLSVSEVAYEVGFSRLNYFSEQFAKQFGVSPTKIRE